VIYRRPAPEDPLDQGDLIDDCPIVLVTGFDAGGGAAPRIDYRFQRVVVLTQTCDFANEKATTAAVAVAFDAQYLVDQQMLKPADIKGPVRAGRVWGWYFLPVSADLGVPEMVINLRRPHTVRTDLLLDLCRAGRRRARVQPLYREHLAKHFADTFSRIGLTEPYPTL
jgi:hypothetical protein